jgi:hypothetical protein
MASCQLPAVFPLPRPNLHPLWHKNTGFAVFPSFVDSL